MNEVKTNTWSDQGRQTVTRRAEVQLNQNNDAFANSVDHRLHGHFVRIDVDTTSFRRHVPAWKYLIEACIGVLGI